VIAAKGSGAHVDIFEESIDGGTLMTSGTNAVIRVIEDVSFDAGPGPGPMTIKGHVVVTDGSTLELNGIYNNSGILPIGETGAGAEVRLLFSTNILQGGGAVELAANGSSGIGDFDVVSGVPIPFMLTNIDNTISGAGSIGGAGHMTFTNRSKGIVNGN